MIRTVRVGKKAKILGGGIYEEKIVELVGVTVLYGNSRFSVDPKYLVYIKPKKRAREDKNG